jgi:hypothetical protein
MDLFAAYGIRPKIWSFAISVKYPSYGNLFGRIFTTVPCRFTIATFLLVHCLHLGHVLYAESVSLTKFYLLFLRNDINVQSKPKSIGISQVPRAHYLGRNGRFSVTGERMGAIVHDAFVIVADAIISDGAVVVFVEVMLLTCKRSTRFI